MTGESVTLTVEEARQLYLRGMERGAALVQTDIEHAVSRAKTEWRGLPFGRDVVEVIGEIRDALA